MSELMWGELCTGVGWEWGQEVVPVQLSTQNHHLHIPADRYTLGTPCILSLSTLIDYMVAYTSNCSDNV